MSEDKSCECGNGKAWEEGVEDTFDRAFDLIAAQVAKGEKPIALCVLSIGDKGNLIFETAVAGAPSVLTEIILSEACLQVADSLQERAMKKPGYKDTMAKLEAAAEQLSKE